MTQEEKVALLKEAGVWDVIGYPTCIDKLFDLVAKHERNRHAWTQEHWTEYEHAIAAAAREAKPKKPEECAKGCPQLQVCDYCQRAEPRGYPSKGREMKSLEDIFTAEELASIDAGTYNVKDLAAKLDYCIALEREACAKVCEGEAVNVKWNDYIEGCEDCAAAIRARGDK